MIDFLRRILTNHGIRIEYEDLHELRKDASFDGYAWPAQNLIVLDISIRGTRQELCVLAEEAGHCLYPPQADHVSFHMRSYWHLSHYERDNLSVLVARDERAALQWGTSFLIPDSAFWEYFKSGPHEWWEWLEHFEVEDWFMRAKVGFMRMQHPFKWREIIVRKKTSPEHDKALQSSAFVQYRGIDIKRQNI